MDFFSILFITTFILSSSSSSSSSSPLISPTHDAIAHFCLYERGNYTVNDTYSNNLNLLVSSISKNNYGFYNMSVGQDLARVHAIALCRGDKHPDECVACIKTAAEEIKTHLCPNLKEAIIWHIDKCMFRYSDREIFNVMETDPNFYASHSNNVTNVIEFNNVLRSLLDDLKKVATSGDSRRKYATGNATAPAFYTIYAQVQCTPDLYELDCDDCLVQYFEGLPGCCGGKQGGKIVGPSCYFRFEIYRFYDMEIDLPPLYISTKNVTIPTGKKMRKSETISIIVVSIVAFVVFIYICICISLEVKKSRDKFEIIETEIGSLDSLRYDFSTIRVATNNFSEENKLGHGGFGVVYKGILANGQEIAVKRLSMDSKQGDQEFNNEVLLVARLQHRNLVRLLGFCLEGNERILIYEFVPNSSLAHFIYDPIRRTHLTWEIRYRIIEGIARGLLYLHEDSRLRIIHRDLKASNILLDTEMNPKVADFGMARLFSLDQTQDDTSNIVGTYGYMAPEYVLKGNFSIKSDVFSFGILVLEIVSGQKNSCFRVADEIEDLLSYTWRSWREGTILDLIDTTLTTTWSKNELIKCIHIGLLCVQENINDRPTMASVVLMLNSNSLTLPTPSQPAFFIHSTITGETEQRLISINEVSISEQHPR